MSMKSTNSPRRVYRRNGVIHTLFAGDIFGLKGDSVIKTNHEVKIVGNGDGTVTVTQRAPKKKGVSEVWSKVKVPSTPRA
jgi:hypothetical protein